MIVIVSGFAGSGKSSLAKSLGKELKLKVIHASGILKELSEKQMHEITPEKALPGKGFWESRKGMEFVKKRLSDTGTDSALDKKLLEIIEEGNAVIDSKTMGYLSNSGKKIWLEASLETRASRIANRDAIPLKEAIEKIRQRDETDKKIYRKLYGFELGKELEKFGFVINNEKLSQKQTLEKTLSFLKAEKVF